MRLRLLSIMLLLAHGMCFKLPSWRRKEKDGESRQVTEVLRAFKTGAPLSARARAGGAFLICA